MDYHREIQTGQKTKKIKIIVGSILIIGLALTFYNYYSSPLETLKLKSYDLEIEEFKNFILRHGKNYESEEDYFNRFQVFRDNSAYIRLFNSLQKSWTLGINQFSDLTPQEFKFRYLNYRTHESPDSESSLFYHDGSNLPASIDWTQKGAVTPIKNELQCGACWAFSATGAVEGAWQIAGNPLVSLSEQQLVDCSSSYGNFGCNGGLMDNSFKYMIAKGITSEQNYPYVGLTQNCKNQAAAKVVARITGYTDVTANSLNSLMAAVAQQPVSVAVDATTWQSYSSGVITGNCPTDLIFAALIVGYDTTTTPNAWKVKNIWGPTWGVAGYLFIEMSAGKGLCGINMEPSFPIAAK